MMDETDWAPEWGPLKEAAMLRSTANQFEVKHRLKKALDEIDANGMTEEALEQVETAFVQFEDYAAERGFD